MELPKAASSAVCATSHVVTKPVTSPPTSFRGTANFHLLREGHVMRNIVRTMVDNMETVLGDLQGIMGDIKSLVVQIDTVTDKIDQKYSEDKPRSVEHVVKKPRCVHVAKANCGTDTSSTSSSAKTMIVHSLRKEEAKHVGSSSGVKVRPSHSGADREVFLGQNVNELTPKHRSRDVRIPNADIESAQSASLKSRHTRASAMNKIQSVSPKLLNIPVDETKQNSSLKPCVKQRNEQGHSKNTSNVPIPFGQSTASSTATQQRADQDWSAKSNSFKVHPRHGAGSHGKHRDSESRKSWPNDIPLPFNLLKKKERKSISPPDETHVGVINPAIQRSMRRNHRDEKSGRKRPPVGPKTKNVAVSESTHQVVKPDIQKSPKATLLRSHEKTPSQERLYEEIPSLSRLKQSSVVVNKSFQPKTPTESRSPITHIGMSPHVHVVKKPSVDSSSMEDFSLSYRPKASRVPMAPRGSGSLPNSPKCRKGSDIEPSSKWTPVIRQTHSPASKKSDCHLYQSLESDLDSETASAVGEYNEIRSLTPDMDWSYLGLVGNQAECCVLNDGYEIPVDNIATELETKHEAKNKASGLFADSPEIVSKVTFPEGSTPSPSDSNTRCTPTFQASIASVIEKICKSPTVNHIFCNEVTSSENGQYCGCYEAVVDSVLENISGFESVEDLGNEFDDVVYETYVSFDDEFEDDDWDVGLKRETVSSAGDGMSLIDFAVDEFFEDDLFFNSEFGVELDEQGNMESHKLSSCAEKTSPILYATKNQSSPASFKRKLSPRSPDYTKSFAELQIGDLRNVAFQRCSFTDEDLCALKPIVPTDESNFTLWPKLHSPSALSNSGDSQSQDMHSSFSSDELSLRLRETDSSNSNMSFSSPDLPACSPDTDVFGTSSDADDIFRSREECSDSFCHEDSFTDNNHRQNIMQLRRDFFDSVFPQSVTSDRDSSAHISNKSTTGSASLALEHDILKAANDNFLDNVSEAGSYNEDRSHYNRNVNTWTAYTMVHMQADDVSDTASDILNDNNSFNNCSLSSSYFDADNVGVVKGNQGIGY